MPTTVAPQACVYTIDATDSISSVSPSWLVFARANGARELTRESVVGRSLWDFIDGERVHELYRLVVE